MNEEIFRKKSLEKVKSPESLDDYIQVANPGVWLLLISVILLLAGVCVWSIFGRIDSTAAANIRVENGSAVCLIDRETSSSVQVGMTVKFGDYEGTIAGVSQDGELYVCPVETGQLVPDGIYSGAVVIESIKPLSFILN